MVLAQKQTHESIEQNRDTRKNPHLYSQLIFNRGSKHIQWDKDSLFNKWCCEDWTECVQKNETTTFLHHTQE